MMQAVRRYATSLGYATVEWQTPAWNVDGRIFSRVLGKGPQKLGDAQ